MNTLETTTEKRSKDGLKRFYVCAHNLQTAKYALVLTSSTKSSSSAKGYKFDNLDEALNVGEEFLKSNFKGIFAHKEFMYSRK